MTRDTSAEMPVVLYMGLHRVEARMKTGGYRLLDILNDRLQEHVTLYDVRMTAHGSDAEEELPHAVITKDRITLAVIRGSRHEAEERRRFSTVDKRQHYAVAIADGFEVRGQLHLEGSPDAELALAGELDSFFALTDASVYHPATRRLEEAEVVMPNKDYLAFLHIAQRERRFGSAAV